MSTATEALVSDPTSGLLPAHCRTDFKASNLLGIAFVGCCLGLSLLAAYLSLTGVVALWFLGQVLLAFCFLQWFVLLHEAGHNTLFRTQRLNRYSGYVAGFLALIPFSSWKLVHGMHHRWTGWQDLDMTTATLVPRRLSWLKRKVVNVCWRFSVPIFAVLYRLNNFWNLPRLWRIFPRRAQRRRLLVGIVISLLAYGLAVYFVGPARLSQAVGLGLAITLVLQDPLILSQHTHVPLRLSGGEPVRPFAPMEQEVFTRSLRFPRWFSRLVLLHVDAHELHHMFPRVPGYYLNRIAYVPHNEVHWWRWLRDAKRVPGEVFLFSNRNESGYDI